MKPDSAPSTSTGPLCRAFLCAAIAATAAAPASAGLFSAKEVPAAWNDSAIKIDGSAAEWDEAAFTEKSGLAVSAANDDKYLYVHISALDRDSAGQLSGRFKQTFTLWLDGDGGKKRSYGVKLTPKTPSGKEERPSGQDAGSGDKKRPEPKAASYSSVILSDGGDGTNSLEADGVEFKAGLNARKRPVLEFKVPLARVFDKTGQFIGLGVETSDIDSSAITVDRGSRPEGGPGGRGGGQGMGGTPPAGGPGGGMEGPPPGGMGGPGRGEGMGGGPGGSAGDNAAQLPDPIGFWLRIKLAAK